MCEELIENEERMQYIPYINLVSMQGRSFEVLLYSLPGTELTNPHRLLHLLQLCFIHDAAV